MTPAERDRYARQLADALAHAGRDPSLLDPLASLTAALAPLPTPEPAVGQVWRVSREDGKTVPALATLTHVSEVLRGVLTIPEAWLATHEDIIVPASASPTGEAMLLAAWSDTPIPQPALAGFVGTLPDVVMNPLLMLLQRRLTGGFKLRATESLPNEGLGAVRWSICAIGNPEAGQEFTTGTRASSPDDGRLVARQALRAASAWLADDVLAEVWEHGGVSEREHWHLTIMQKLRSAVEALGDAVLGGDRTPTSPLLVAGGAPPPYPAWPHLLGGVAGAFHVGGLLGAVRTAERATAPETLNFILPLEDAKIEITVETTSEQMSVMAMATRDGKPLKGIKMGLRFVGSTTRPRAHSMTTGKDGLAYLANVHFFDGEGMEITLGNGSNQRVISVR